jgi:hypothetical protein
VTRPQKIEWPEKARIAVVLQVPFEQYGHPFGAWAYDQVIRYAKGFQNVWFATRRQIAEWYLSHYA